MANNEILNSVAMMSALYDSIRGDYYDLLCCFVKSVLPSNIGEEIQKEQIAFKMNDEYGFKPPLAIIEKLLRRLTRDKNNVIRIENNRYYINKKVDNQQFNLSRYNIKSKNEKITHAFIDFTLANFGEKITEEHSNMQLRDFFERFGNEIYNGDNLDLTITMIGSKSNRVYYRIGRFISNEKNKNSSLYLDILEVVKGYLIFNAIYFFFKNTKKDVKSKLSGVKFVFDSALILDLLDYHDNGNLSKELFKLIKEYDGEICVFEHTIKEIKNILFAYLKKSYEIREMMQIVKYRRNNYSNEQISRDIELVESRIAVLGIKIITPTVIIFNDGDDFSKLGLIKEDYLRELYLNKFRQSPPNESGIDHDIKCISIISRLRMGNNFGSLESCIAIFITKNIKLVNAAQMMIDESDKYREENVINLAMKETDLTAILWLNKYNEFNSIPDVILMEKVYAAINASDDVIRKYFDELKLLEEDHKLSEEAAFVLRTSEIMREQMVIESQNEVEEVTSQMIIRMYESFESQIAEKHVELVESKYRERDEKSTAKIEKTMANKASEHATIKMEDRKKSIKIAIIITSVLITSIIVVLNTISFSKKQPIIYSFVFALIINLPNIDFIFGKGRIVERFFSNYLENYRVREFKKKLNEYRFIVDDVSEEYV